MSVDLSKVVGWDTDRGALVQITDASGRVLWKQAPSGAIVTIVVSAGFEKDVLLIDGVYYGKQSTELTLPIGTVITISSDMWTLNGSVMSTKDYTVIGKAEIRVSGYKPNQYATVSQVHIYEQ